jgi:lipid-binding SYLF domain-containing protein
MEEVTMYTTKLAIVLASSAGLLFAANEAEKRLTAANTTIAEIMASSDKGIPQDLLNKAACVVIVPGLKKGAFIVGGKFGRGFVLCRKDSGVGWSAPASIKVEGGSFGFQIGGSETDVVMLILNKSGIDKLLQSKFTLGGDASVAAGPVGRASSADTDATFRAEILTYSRSRGVFAGISLQGATLRPDNDANEELYTGAKTNRDILTGDVAAPASAEPLIRTLNKYSSRK